MSHTETHTRLVKEAAARTGFDFCGIAKAGRLDADAKRLEKWLAQGRHGSMTYMERNFELRIDPTRLVPGAKSVITLLKNYFPVKEMQGNYRISKYAYGKDYHEVIRAQLKHMIDRIETVTGSINGRGFVDSAPVLERAWALKSGLGWIGKNGNLITRHGGSFFFIATLITDLELEPDDAFAKDFCGSCTRCIDACPTEAILPDKQVDGSRCISYFTIELKDLLIPDEMNGKFQNWMFGCDVCQDVCPWNRFSKPHHEPAFDPVDGIFDISGEDWENLQEDAFRKIFRQSAVKRAKHAGLMRNILFLKKSPGDEPGDDECL